MRVALIFLYPGLVAPNYESGLLRTGALLNKNSN